MPDTPTLVIRGGTIIDGSGDAPYQADIAIEGNRIVAIGNISTRGAEEIDATGKLVTPGFVDVHTHYDAQVTWANHITPSSNHGVTTTLIGNCGVGFAPCRPEQRAMLVALMEGVEDIPEIVLTEGLQWNWQTFPDFLDALDARHFDLDVATQVPHAALRVYVMGQRGADREPATPADCAAMARLAAEGIRAGALGFSTSRTINHKTLDGRHIPTLKADEAELAAIARAVGETGAGWLQVIADFDDEIDTEFAMLRRLVATSGRPMTITVLERDSKPQEWRRLLDHIATANVAGERMTGQVLGRPTGIMLGFEISQHPFVACPSYQAIAHLAFPQRIAALRQPELRARILAEATPGRTTTTRESALPAASRESASPMTTRESALPGTSRAPALPMTSRVRAWDRIFPLGDPPDYEPPAERSLGARARAMGVDPAALAYDTLLEHDGHTILYRPLSNYARGNLDTAREMMTHPNTLLGLGDGGAHVSVLCDASAPTSMLTHWTRDRRTGRFPVEWAIKRLTRDNALAMGLADRGLLAPGMKADLNVIDYDHLTLHAPHVVYDLPAGGRRLMQDADGYVATIVSGVVTARDGTPTGALPGRLIRGAKQAASG